MSHRPESISLGEGRFSRLEAIKWWDQSLLREARVLVVGAGALGNEVIKNLSLLGVGRLAIVDMDRIEASNLSRSVLFREADEAQPKAVVAARAAQEIYPDLRAHPIVGNLMSDVGLGWFRWAQVVVAALDNREARVFVNSACAKVGRAWIDGGIDILNGLVRAFDPPKTACYECTMGQADWDLLAKRRSCSLLARFAASHGGTPTTPTTASIIGAIQAQEVVKRLHGLESLSGSGFVFEGLSHQSYSVSYPILEECPWHQRPADIDAFDQWGSDTPLATIAQEAREKLGGLDAIDFSRELVERIVCPRCGLEIEVFQPLERLTQEQARCAACQGECVPVFLHSLACFSPLMGRTARQLGLPAWDVVWARYEDKAIGIEWQRTDLRKLKETGVGGKDRDSSSKNMKKPSADDADADVKASGWEPSSSRPRWQKFPGPQQVGEPLRINFSRSAYADVVAHAKAHLDVEICGVLGGELCEDEEGLFVSVQAAVRGVAAQQKGARVTFTQETWNKIHESMEKDHPRLQIVGWYHSHPGFGVEFSDMDLFIQKNFFCAPGQLALVTDPLGGDDAVCIMSESGIKHVGRFYVDGRERRCYLPGSQSGEASSSGSSAQTEQALRAMEERLSQALAAMDSLRNNIYRFATFIGMFIALSVAAWIAYSIYKQSTSSYNPPTLGAFAQSPVKIEDHWYWVGSQAVTCRVATEMEAALCELQQKQQEAAHAQRKGQQAAASQAAATSQLSSSSATSEKPNE